MASPHRVRLFSPFRVWSALSALFLLLAIGASYSIWSVSRSEAIRLLQIQTSTLVRSNLSDLEDGNFRAFAERVGQYLQHYSLVVSEQESTYTYGAAVKTTLCGTESYQSISRGTIGVRICSNTPSTIWLLIPLLFSYFLISLWLLRIMQRLERSTARTLSSLVTDLGVKQAPSNDLHSVLAGISTIQEDLIRERERSEKLARTQALGELASKVAHDLRSPVAALNLILSRGDETIPFSSDTRNLATAAIQRIRGIANSLLTVRKEALAEDAYSTLPNAGRLSLHPIATLIDSVVSEKSAGLTGRSIEIRTASSNNFSGIECRVDPVEFQSIMSNIIDNSLESLPDTGGVVDILVHSECETVIRVWDNGCGIPPEVLSALKEGPYTHGKANGNGLGIYQAQKTLATWGGRLSINSKEGSGTTVTLILPHETPNSYNPTSHPPHDQPNEPLLAPIG